MEFVFDVDPYDIAMDGADALLGHWEQVANDKDKIELKPDLEKYKQMQDLGIMRNVCAIEDGVVVGYSILFIQPHIHYCDDLFAYVDVIYVAESHRNSRVGLKLINLTEDIAREAGASILQYHTKVDHQAIEKILYRKGYNHRENIIGITLKGES